jgi:hypothetical protein
LFGARQHGSAGTRLSLGTRDKRRTAPIKCNTSHRLKEGIFRHQVPFGNRWTTRKRERLTSVETGVR